jgi:hypothetical protein
MRLPLWSRFVPGSIRGLLIETAVVLALLALAVGLAAVLTLVF